MISKNNKLNNNYLISIEFEINNHSFFKTLKIQSNIHQRFCHLIILCLTI